MKTVLQAVGVVMLIVFGISGGVFFIATLFILLGPYVKWLEHLIGVS